MTTQASNADRGAGDPSQRPVDRWIVLLVDDEPDVHEITRLVLAGMSFSEVPIELHSAYSASEAKAFLELHPNTALMLLDVVMETDDAGLRLIGYVRDQVGNGDLQIIVRTGQPGMAPEREVISRYDINGYFLKTELVVQKLRSIVISSLRAFKHIRSLRMEPGPPDAPLHTVQAAGRAFVEPQLHAAIETDSLHLLAQPQVHLVTGAIAGIELIPSWPQSDSVWGPARLADEVRDPELRLKFDKWLVRQACAWAEAWQSVGLPPFRVSVPILSEDIWDGRLMECIRELLRRDAIPHGTLDLEVPEQVLLVERGGARDVLAAMRSAGLSLTLVDFGSGLFSLPRLRRLLPDRVKIHHSFVRNVTQDRERSAVARSLLALVHTLELTAIADGLLSEQDLQFFKWEGCDIGQGDILARSMAVAAVSEGVRARAMIAPRAADLH